MKRLPRRLALWGGAAAIAGGGFAFMASNTVFNSSAGEGTGTVSGYTVSTISYTVTNVSYSATGLRTLTGSNSSITNVTFRLTSTANKFDTTTPAAVTPPKNVNVWPEKSTGAHPWGHAGGCASTSTWTRTTPTTQGTGTFSCTFSPAVPTMTLSKLDVEANQ